MSICCLLLNVQKINSACNADSLVKNAIKFLIPSITILPNFMNGIVHSQNIVREGKYEILYHIYDYEGEKENMKDYVIFMTTRDNFRRLGQGS